MSNTVYCQMMELLVCTNKNKITYGEKAELTDIAFNCKGNQDEQDKSLSSLFCEVKRGYKRYKSNSVPFSKDMNKEGNQNELYTFMSKMGSSNIYECNALGYNCKDKNPRIFLDLVKNTDNSNFNEITEPSLRIGLSSNEEYTWKLNKIATNLKELTSEVENLKDELKKKKVKLDSMKTNNNASSKAKRKDVQNLKFYIPQQETESLKAFKVEITSAVVFDDNTLFLSFVNGLVKKVQGQQITDIFVPSNDNSDSTSDYCIKLGDEVVFANKDGIYFYSEGNKLKHIKLDIIISGLHLNPHSNRILVSSEKPDNKCKIEYIFSSNEEPEKIEYTNDFTKILCNFRRFIICCNELEYSRELKFIEISGTKPTKLEVTIKLDIEDSISCATQISRDLLALGQSDLRINFYKLKEDEFKHYSEFQFPKVSDSASTKITLLKLFDEIFLLCCTNDFKIYVRDLRYNSKVTCFDREDFSVRLAVKNEKSMIIVGAFNIYCKSLISQ